MLKTVWNVPNSDRFQNCIICWKNTEILLKFLLIFCSALSEICLECSNFSQISDIEFRKISDNIQNKISKKFIYVSAKNLHEGFIMFPHCDSVFKAWSAIYTLLYLWGLICCNMNNWRLLISSDLFVGRSPRKPSLTAKRPG